MESESTRSEAFNRLVELVRAEFWKEKRTYDEIYYKALEAVMRVYEKAWNPDSRLSEEALQVALKSCNERVFAAREGHVKAVREALERFGEKVESLRDMMES